MGVTIFQMFFLLAPALGAYVFPDDFQLCRKDDENLNECVLSAIRDALPKLANEGISSPISIKTEPMLYPYCVYHPSNVAVSFDEYFFNLSHIGFVNSTVTSASVNPTTFELNFTTFTPHFVQNSKYIANGTVLYNGTRNPEPFWGSGPSVKDLYNTTILHQLKSIEVTKQGKTYLQVQSYNTSISLDFITLNYQNLYNGTNPEMAERANGYVNSTGMYSVGTIKEDIEAFFASMFKTYTNEIIGSIPINELIPGVQQNL